MEIIDTGAAMTVADLVAADPGAVETPMMTPNETGVWVGVG